MEKLTMQEEEAMRWIWRIGPCFVKDVLAKYRTRNLLIRRSLP